LIHYGFGVVDCQGYDHWSHIKHGIWVLARIVFTFAHQRNETCGSLNNELVHAIETFEYRASVVSMR
jgi:hypothetical protein